MRVDATHPLRSDKSDAGTGRSRKRLPISCPAWYNERRNQTPFGKPSMRRILSLYLLMALTWPCHAQQKPNTLTPKEIADGWILLFDGETTFGWTEIGRAHV